MKLASENFLQEASAALNAQEKVARRNLLGQFLPLARDSAASKFGDFDALRAHMKQVRRHTSEHLSHYLQQFEEAAVQHGNQVHFVVDLPGTQRQAGSQGQVDGYRGNRPQRASAQGRA
jgi:L-lactate dehydrogenase complex protein LldF